jgi:hypothetical protein
MLQVYIKKLPSIVKRNKIKVTLGFGFSFISLTILRHQKSITLVKSS